MKNNAIKRIVTNAIFLAILCLIGSLSIVLANNLKLTLQILVVFLISLYLDFLIDKIIVVGLYVAMGFLLPIYAGFMVGFSPTWGFVLGFLIGIIPAHFIAKINDKLYIKVLSLITILLFSYAIGLIFMYFYLDRSVSLDSLALLSIVPYIPFDIAKIVLAIVVEYHLFIRIKNKEE